MDCKSHGGSCIVWCRITFLCGHLEINEVGDASPTAPGCLNSDTVAFKRQQIPQTKSSCKLVALLARFECRPEAGRRWGLAALLALRRRARPALQHVSQCPACSKGGLGFAFLRDLLDLCFSNSISWRNASRVLTCFWGRKMGFGQ